METTTKILRLYQVRLVTDVCRATEDVLVEQPTGSGKTVQIVTLVAMHLGQRFTHAVISAPQEQIEQGFVKRDYARIAFPDCQGVAQPALAVPERLIRGARASGLGAVKQIAAYLRQTGSTVDQALACTHAALNQLTPEKMPADLTGRALFIDEAHHASADGLSQIVALWRERGGQLFFFTATPYRGDGRPVVLERMRTFRRSLAEHMAEGFAPRHLESEIVALGKPGDAITPAQFCGEEAPEDIEEVVAAVCLRWLADGKPKAIVRLPPMRDGLSREMVRRLLQVLASQGARVLDATGTGAADKQRFLTGLEAEKDRTHATSTFDVMVGIQRVLEGTDWPVCSAVYCVGMPGSLNTVVQFLGRAMRLKGADYPADQRDRAKLVFFVPCGGGAALADLSLDHSRHALLTCCFLADHEVGQEWIVLREVRRGIEAALGKPAENPAAADAENEADQALDPAVRAEVELVMASTREQIISSGGEPTVGEVVRVAATTRPDLPEAALQQVAAEILAAQTDSSGNAVREAIQQEVAKRVRIDPMVKKAMKEAFAVVLNEFRDVTLKDSAVLDSVGRQVHGVTGGQMQAFAQRLRDAVPRPLTEELILKWADAHQEKIGEWPKCVSGFINDAPSETWKNIDNVLRQGSRGLPGGSSLPQLLAERRGVRNQYDQPLTEEQILTWADEHYERTGDWPSLNSGPVHAALGETWSGINAALNQGGRSLSSSSSLANLLAEQRGVRNMADLPPLTIEQILAWADAHHERTGEWPKEGTGSVLDAPGESWKGVKMALVKGRRGLPGGSSLPRLLAEQRGVRNHYDLPGLSVDKILDWADLYRERTSKWPNAYSGVVADDPEATWARINTALIEGIRGLTAGSSLARLLAEHRGKRNHLDLPALSEVQILVWADAHHARTGKWPNEDSGAVADSTTETWLGITKALAKGSRSLPGGSSLAQVLMEHRGKRNHLRLSHLTIDQILIWADSYHAKFGKWPDRQSGAVEGALGEKWGNVDGALKKGLRGLPSGSSLVRLIREHRSGPPT